jgi:hypothetical protein
MLSVEDNGYLEAGGHPHGPAEGASVTDSRLNRGVETC